MKRMAGTAVTAVLLFSPVPEQAQAQHEHPPGGEHRPHMEHSFEDVERWVKDFEDPERDGWQMPERVIQALELEPHQVVADLGAGTGYFSVRLAASAAAPLVYAVDVEPAMVEYLRQRAQEAGLEQVKAVLASPDDPQLPEPVDLVLIVNTYHHLPDRPAYFQRLRRQMKPSGRLAIIDYRKGAADGPPEEFRFRPDQIGRELAGAGFRLESEHDFLPRQIFLVYRAD